MPATAASHAPGNPTKCVVLLRIQRIDADADAHDADLDQFLGHAVVDQHAVGAEHDHETELHGMTRDVENVGAHQRLATGDDQQAALVHLGDLIDEACSTRRSTVHRIPPPAFVVASR